MIYQERVRLHVECRVPGGQAGSVQSLSCWPPSACLQTRSLSMLWLAGLELDIFHLLLFKKIKTKKYNRIHGKKRDQCFLLAFLRKAYLLLVACCWIKWTVSPSVPTTFMLWTWPQVWGLAWGLEQGKSKGVHLGGHAFYSLLMPDQRPDICWRPV